MNGNFAVNYVDDFLGVEYITHVWRAHGEIVKLLEVLGVGRSESKSVPPAHIVEFVGNLLNTENMTIGVTPARKVELLRELESWRTRVNCTRRQLESLVGKLQFVGNVVKPGRLFVSRMLQELKAMKRGRMYKVNTELRKDIKWWYLFLPGFQGTGIMWLIDVFEIDAEMSVDSCMVGAGGVCGKEFYRVKFPAKVLTPEVRITHLELWAVILAVHIWGHRCTGKIIRMRSDNEAVACIVNTGRSRDLLLQKLLRELTWWLSVDQFRIKSVHLKGSLNRLPNMLSRWHEGEHVRKQFNDEGGVNMIRQNVLETYFTFTHEW